MLKRYTLPSMVHLWMRPETKFESWLEVELAFLRARVELGEIPAEAFETIKTYARIDVAKIEELEAIYDHDMLAFVGAVQSSLKGTSAEKYASEFHKGITSYDVEDPALVIILREAASLILNELRDLEAALRQHAKKHQWTLMIARTHGKYAEPTTFGHLLLTFAELVNRSVRRLSRCITFELSEGKISGAVGNYGSVNPELEERALKYLKLVPAASETQILQRDRIASFLSVLATAAGTIEQMCRTFWEMMRSDAGELEEPRKPKQRGSSAMPHKKNPILTERLMGLARVVRSSAQAAQENIATPEWRDISQSSVERHILPDATSILHYMTAKATFLVSNLVVFLEQMEQNLEEKTLGVWAAQNIRIALMESGLGYDEAYELVQHAAFRAEKERTPLCEILRDLIWSKGSARSTVQDILGVERFEQCFDARAYIERGISHIFRNADKEVSDGSSV